MLWNSAMEERGLSDEDRAYYQSMTDGLLEELYTSLVSLNSDEAKEYESVLAEKPVPEDYPEAENEDGD
jgi:hypothetical protein